MMISLNDLAENRSWVAWAEERTQNGMTTKVPKNPYTGYNARVPTDPSTYGTRAEAISCRKKINGNGGIGIVLDSIGNDFHQVGIDLDSCRDAQSEIIAPWAEEIINRFDTYAEVSPSQSGVKLFFQVTLADLGRLQALLGQDPHGRQKTRKAFSIGEHREVAIDTARFYAVTGYRLKDSPEDLRTVPFSDVEWFIKEAAPNYLARHKASNGQEQQSSFAGCADKSGSGYGFRFLQACHRQGMSKTDALAALLIDSSAAGEWARRSDERQLDRAWDNSRPSLRVESQAEVASDGEGVSLQDFRAYMPQHNYIYMPTREMWVGASVNSRLPKIPLTNLDGTPKLKKDGQQETMTPTCYLDKERPVEQITWAPGLPMLITDRFISEGGWIGRRGVTTFNLYRPPTIVLGDPRRAGPWVRLIIKLFGKNDARHIISWCAYRRQHPEIKINHALVLGSEEQGIGKDTVLEPVVRAVGAWNCKEVSPKSVTGRFNPFLKSVLLRVSEVRDLGDVSRYDFYEAMKAYSASPPDVLTCDEKNLREHSILNCVGIIYTTNHKQGGMFLPAEDRRHFVAWSERKKTDFAVEFWPKMWAWIDSGGDSHVAAYLASFDISKFNPKAPPPQTPAFWEIVDSNRAPEQSELADVLDQMDNPQATTLDMLAEAAGTQMDHEFASWLKDRKNRRIIPHRMEKCGYVVVRNDTADDGLWRISDKRQTVYALAKLSASARHKVATALQQPGKRRTFK